MASIQDILQFHFSPTTFKQSAQDIIPVTLDALNDHRIDKLQKITMETGANAFEFTNKHQIPTVFKKFKKYFEGANVSFDRRELRTLTYSLSHSEPKLPAVFNSESELHYVLTLLENNWRDSFLFGLIDCFLNNWETKHQRSLGKLELFIINKLDDYSGNRSTLLSFKNNKRFFNLRNGDLVLGDTLAKLNKPILEATKILGVPESWLPYAYFSKVIVTYFEKSKSNISDKLDTLNEVLQKHNNSITNKRLISKAIILFNQPQLSAYQDKIKSIAFKQIGDPGHPANWTAFEHATDIEKAEIFQAKNILNEWITRQFITVFFNVCINDDRRKRFWLRYASKISSFIVVGPEHTKNILECDERIAEYVGNRFKTVISKQNIAAFILDIGDHMLIEFSDKGYAAIAYKNTSDNKAKLKKQLYSVEELRNTTMPVAVDNGCYHEEGRLIHNDGNQIWETKFNNWMNAKVFR
jgi:hypothetical protein